MQNDDPEIARRFVRWHKMKVEIEKYKQPKKVKEGQIYWASLGQNVGSEIYGKNEQFVRPAVVFKKSGRDAIMCIPLTSRRKFGSWYVPFVHKGKRQTAVINQAKTISTKRLWKFMGQVDEADFARIKRGFHDFYCG